MGLFDYIRRLLGGEGDAGDDHGGRESLRASESTTDSSADASTASAEEGGVEGLEEMVNEIAEAGDGDEMTDEDAAEVRSIMSEVHAAAEQVRDAEDDDEDLEPPARFEREAAELADFWSEHDLDFTPASLERLDDFVDRQWEKDRFRDVETADDGVHVDELAFQGIVVQLGSYFGETLVRTHEGASWADDEDFGWAVTVDGPEGEATVNVFHVAQDCLREPSKFALTYETVVRESGVGEQTA